MRHTITTIFCMAIIATTLAKPQTAKAEVATAASIVSAIAGAYQAYKKYTDGSIDLDEATRKIGVSITRAKREIIDHIDSLVESEGVSCAKAVIINAESIDGMTLTAKQILATGAVDCMTTIEGYIYTVANKGSLDSLGFAFNALTPVALIIREHAQFSTTEKLVDVIASANLALEARLSPACRGYRRSKVHNGRYMDRLGPDSIDDIQETWKVKCWAYNGNYAWGTRSIFDTDAERDAIMKRTRDWATRYTSRYVAQRVLDDIDELLPESTTTTSQPMQISGAFRF